MTGKRVRRELDRDNELVDMLSLAGLGAELWQEVDITAYLERERASCFVTSRSPR